jgi:hypothetical protein
MADDDALGLRNDRGRAAMGRAALRVTGPDHLGGCCFGTLILLASVAASSSISSNILLAHLLLVIGPREVISPQVPGCGISLDGWYLEFALIILQNRMI